jgi:hypothetical protein
MGFSTNPDITQRSMVAKNMNTNYTSPWQPSRSQLPKLFTTAQTVFVATRATGTPENPLGASFTPFLPTQGHIQ